jgi:hypothetical protein
MIGNDFIGELLEALSEVPERPRVVPAPMPKTGQAKRVSTWYARNAEKAKAKSKAYRRKNRDRVKATYQAKKDTRAWRINRWWAALNDRTVNGSHPRRDSQFAAHYLDRGIRLELTREQLADFVNANWGRIEEIRAAGGKESIDRIDPELHYSPGNIQIIPLSENIAKANRNR